MYEFLTGDMRKPLPVDVDDLMAQKYIVAVVGWDDEGVSFLMNRFFYDRTAWPLLYLITESDLLENFCELSQNTRRKFAFLLLEMQIRMLLRHCKAKSFELLKDKDVRVSLGCLATKKNAIISQLFREVMNRFVESGIASHFYETANEYLNPLQHDEEKDNRRVLTLGDLEYGFVQWFIAAVVSIIAFVCELFALYLRKKCRRLIGLFYFMRLLNLRLLSFHDFQ